MQVRQSGEEWKIEFVRAGGSEYPVISLAPFPIVTTTYNEAAQKGLAGRQHSYEHYRVFSKNKFVN